MWSTGHIFEMRFCVVLNTKLIFTFKNKKLYAKGLQTWTYGQHYVARGHILKLSTYPKIFKII